MANKFVKEIDIIFKALGKDTVKNQINALIKDIKYLQKEANKGLSFANQIGNTELKSIYANLYKDLNNLIRLGNSDKNLDQVLLKLAEGASTAELKIKTLNKQFKIDYLTPYNNKLSKLKNQFDALRFSVEKQVVTQQRWTSPQNITKANQLVQAIKTQEIEVNKLAQEYERLSKIKDKALASGDNITLNKTLTNLKSIQNQIKHQEEMLNSFRTRVRDVKEDLGQLSRGKWLVETGKRAMAYAGLYTGIFALVNMTQKAIEYSNQLDQAQHQLKGVLKMSAYEASNLTKQIKTLSMTYGGTIEEIKNVTLELGRAGMANQQLGKATEIVMKMALLTGDSYGVATSALVSFNEVFGKQIAQTYKGKDALDVLGNKLAAIANDSRMTTQDIGTFGNYALAVSKQVGMTVDMVGALAVSFNNAGNNASTIGTMIRRLGNTLDATQPKIKKFWANVGIDGADLRRRMQKGGAEGEKAFRELVTKLGQMSEEEFAQATSGLDILAKNTMAQVHNSWQTILHELDRLKATTSGEFKGINDIINSNTKVWERFKSVVGAVADQLIKTPLHIGGQLLNSLIGGTDNLDKTKQKVNELVSTISFAIQTVVNFGLAFGAIKFVGFLASITRIQARLRLLRITMASTTSSAIRMNRAFLSVRAIGGALVNPITLAFGALELFTYWSNKSAEAQEKLQHSLHLSINEMNKMSKVKLKIETIDIKKQLAKVKQDLNDAILDEVNMKQGKNFLQFDKTYSEEERLAIINRRQELEKEVATLEKKLQLLARVYDAKVAEEQQTYNQLGQLRLIDQELVNSSNSAMNVANSASYITTELYNAKLQAIDLDKALNVATAGVQKQLIRAKEIAGAISKVQAIKMTYDVDKKTLDKSFKDLNTKFELAFEIKDEKKRAETIKKLNIEAQQLASKKLSLQNQYNQKLKQEEERHNRIELSIKKQKNLINAYNSKGKNATTKAQIKNIELEINAIKKKGIKTDEDELKLLTLQNQKLSLTNSLNRKAHNTGVKALKNKNAIARKQQHINDLHKVANQELEKQKSIQKQIDDLKKNWWVFDKDSVKSAKEKLDLAIAEKNALKGHSSKVKIEKAVTKEYEARLNLLKAQHDQLKEIYSIYNSGVGSMLKGDFEGGIKSIFSGLSDKLMQPLQSQISSYLTQQTSSLFSGLTALEGGAIGATLSYVMNNGTILEQMLGFRHKLTQAEIDSATGRKDFDSKYFEQSAKLWADYAKKGNDLAVRQLDRLKSIDANMATIALGATSTQNGFRLDGKDMVATKDNGFFGLFASSKTPLGSGIEILTQSIQQLTNNIQARGYQSYKVTDSGLFGFFGGESIETNYRNLSTPLLKALQDTVNKSLDSVADNLSVLGFDDTRFKEEIQKQVVSLGKIDFKDIKDPAEQMQVLKAGIGEMLGNAVNGALSSFADPQMLQSLYSWQQAGEDILTTTSRVAVGFKEVDLDLSFFGQHLSTFNQSQELIKAAGGLEAFSSGMQTFIKGFFSSDEQKQYLQMQLNYALGVYNMSLPASKAQFKAMVLEVQQKILTTRATIDTLKAEIAAKVASGQMSLKAAYGQLEGETAIANARAGVTRQQIEANNYLINSAQQAGEASVGFGKSVHNAVDAMITGAGEAIKQGVQVTPDGVEIDYSRITSPAIREAEAQLQNLEGLYGTLMSNMSSFSSYYNDMGSSISSANNSIASSISSANNSIVSSTNELLDKKKEYIDLINKEIEYRNNLAKAVDDMQKSVQNSFEQLLGKSVPKMLYDLDTAINNKDYEHISEAFNNYAKGLTDTATSKEQWLRGLISANAKVQGMEKPHELDLLDVNKANEYNTRKLADMYAKINADNLKSDNWHNKLDKNNELLEELIALQKEANRDGKEIIALTEAQKRNAEASELRAKYGEGVA